MNYCIYRNSKMGIYCIYIKSKVVFIVYTIIRKIAKNLFIVYTINREDQ
jgi:hypothetical protein